MPGVKVESNLSDGELQRRTVAQWGVWEKEVSSFSWTYDAEEVCYEGEVEVTPDGGATVLIKAGDFVTFPAGMSCHWNITFPVRNHFNFN